MRGWLVKNKGAISERIGVGKVEIKTAQVLTAGGVQGVRLIDEDTVCEWLLSDNPQMAKKMLKLGVRVFLHKLAGYKVSSSAVQPKTTAEMFLENAQILGYARPRDAVRMNVHQDDKRTLGEINRSDESPLPLTSLRQY